VVHPIARRRNPRLNAETEMSAQEPGAAARRLKDRGL
jgi:hypothetical protein